MRPLTSARSAERSSRTSRRRPTRNRHNRPMKKKNQPVVVGLKVLPAGQAGHLGGLADLLVVLLVLPVGQAGPPEGAAEDDGPRKGQRQRKREHSERKREHRKDKSRQRKGSRIVSEVSLRLTGLRACSICR